MAIVSMPFSVPTLKYPKKTLSLNRINRGVAFASLGKEKPTAGVKVIEGEGNLPKVVLTTSHGSVAEMYLFGACITSWKIPNGKDLLFVRPDAVFDNKKPISGGIPHCFPQFGPGAIQQHGFARNMDWLIVDSGNSEGNPVVTVELKDGPYSRAMWDFGFQALYKVTLQQNSLLTELIISNTDNKPFSFSAALHTYFRASVYGASVKDLSGCKTFDKHPDPNNPKEGKEEREAVPFPRFVDCIYRDTPSLLRLHNGLSDVIMISNTNWPDAVLWNPYEQMEACYRDFVCVENAQIDPVHLEPGKSWTAKQCLSVK